VGGGHSRENHTRGKGKHRKKPKGGERPLTKGCLVAKPRHGKSAPLLQGKGIKTGYRGENLKSRPGLLQGGKPGLIRDN